METIYSRNNQGFSNDTDNISTMCFRSFIHSFIYLYIYLFICFQTIKSRDAWNSPENAVDFPRCYFEIRHVDRTKQSFFCRIKASHEGDVARAEIVGYFERVNFML